MQITNKIIPTGTSNRVETFPTERLLRNVRIALKQEVNAALIVTMNPREVLFEGGRELPIVESHEGTDRFYVYGKTGIIGIYLTEAKAVSAAYDNSGVVINSRGDYIWYRGNLAPSKRIMEIEGTLMPEYSSSLAVCLDVILQYEGITQSSYYLLRRGETALSILRNNLPNIELLDLTGCSLDSILYYVNRDIPVMAMLDDGNAVLIVGFEELNIFLMDPLVGEVFRMGRNDTTALFEDNGNRFITYVRRGE
jgi:hypothetical protein